MVGCRDKGPAGGGGEGGIVIADPQQKLAKWDPVDLQRSELTNNHGTSI